MKKLLITVVLIIAAVQANAQKLEFSVDAASVFSHYSGNFAASRSFIVTTSGNEGYTNNPYSKKLTFGYAFGGQLQVVNGGFIVGLQSGYEVLKSGMPIYGVQMPVQDYVFYNSFTTTAPTPAHGTTTLTSNVININPYFGYRIKAGLLHIDLTPGVDIAVQTKLVDKGSASIDNSTNVYYVNRNDYPKHTDTRLRMGAAAGFKRWSIFAAYAHGLTNLVSGIGGNPKVAVRSEMVRAGLSYRLF